MDKSQVKCKKNSIWLGYWYCRKTCVKSLLSSRDFITFILFFIFFLFIFFLMHNHSGHNHFLNFQFYRIKMPHKKKKYRMKYNDSFKYEPITFSFWNSIQLTLCEVDLFNIIKCFRIFSFIIFPLILSGLCENVQIIFNFLSLLFPQRDCKTKVECTGGQKWNEFHVFMNEFFAHFQIYVISIGFFFFWFFF